MRGWPKGSKGPFFHSLFLQNKKGLPDESGNP